MPKVKLNRDMRQERIEFRRNLIESKAHLRGYRTQKDVERAAGMPASWLSKRLTGSVHFDADDFDTLDKLLKFDAQELAQLVRCR